MNAIAEIDKTGRLVVPKKLRDALRLIPGTRLTLEQKGEVIILQPESKSHRLRRKNGILVYDSGKPIPTDAVNWIEEHRSQRAEELMGKWPQL